VQHLRGYVAQVLQAFGFTPEIERAELRMEGGLPVAGLVVRATRAGGSRG
jgi:hypothetical protein